VSPWDMAKPLVDETIDQDPQLRPRGSDAFLPCRAAVVPLDPHIHRRDHPTLPPEFVSCWRKLNLGRQALLVLAYPRKGETFR
jgi:hypothetical protein